jgi:hypothetical protein
MNEAFRICNDTRTSIKEMDEAPAVVSSTIHVAGGDEAAAPATFDVL